MIAIIDYGASNLQSVCNALKKLRQEFTVVKNPQSLAGAKKVLLPGVSASGPAMQQLLESGFIDYIAGLKIPFLGICLGMQLLANFSEESNVQCLSIIPGKVKKIPSEKLKVPHIGWNKVALLNASAQSPLLVGISNESYFYFVHSFYFEAPEEMTIGKTYYGIGFSSIIQKKNFYGVQFHPEKSGEIGLQLLNNFCTQC